MCFKSNIQHRETKGVWWCKQRQRNFFCCHFVPKMLFAELVLARLFAQLLLCAPLQLQTKQIILCLQIASASAEARRSWEVGTKQGKLFLHNCFEQDFLRAIPGLSRVSFSFVLSLAWFVCPTGACPAPALGQRAALGTD